MFLKKRADKRRFPRINDFSLVKYRSVSSEGKHHEFKVTNIRDIGEGGVGFWVREKLIAPNLIELRINFPPFDVPISTLAKIIWVKKVGWGGQYKVGVKFVDIEDTFRKMIADKVKAEHKK